MIKIFHLILFFLCFIFLVHFVSAIECGSIPTNGCTITQNTNFTQGIYNLSSGISVIVDGITLDCNGSTLFSPFGGSGIDLTGKDNVIIKNCIIRGYDQDINLRYSGSCSSPNPPNSNKIINNSFSNSTYGIYMVGVLCPSGEHFPANNEFMNNYFFENHEGAYIKYSRNSNFTQNNFVNNTDYGAHLAISSIDSIIYNNSFYNTSIRYDETNNNKYCLNNQYPNNYYDGAMGPTCSCILPQDQFLVNSNEIFCKGNYSLPGGFTIADNINLNCNGSRLMGSQSPRAISLRGVNNINLSNCIIENYSTGIYMGYTGNCGSGSTVRPSNHDSFYNNLFKANEFSFYLEGISCLITGIHGIDDNLFSNNTFINGSRGIYGIYSRNNNISLNNFENNSYGIYFNLGTDSNKIYHNNFIENNISAIVMDVNQAWNITGFGNYWSDYDSHGEGCNNANLDQFCDSPYNRGGSNLTDYFPYIVQDGWLLGPQVGEPMPVQVIPDVDMVKGKTTLIRIPIIFTSVLSNDTITPNITLYWNGTLIGRNLTSTFSYNETKNIDFWYVPQNVGTNLPISVVVTGTSANGINYTDGNSKSVNVVQTRNLSLTFVSVDGPTNFDGTVEGALGFIQKLYPIKDNGIQYVANKTGLTSNVLERNNAGAYLLLYRVHKSTLVSGQLPERAIGILKENWFDNFNFGLGSNKGGISLPLNHGAVLVEEDFDNTIDHVSAHELGHTYELCDENNETEWNRQNELFGGDYCPNGDSNNDEILDLGCVPYGCPTIAFIEFEGSVYEFESYNLMGGTIDPLAWISKDSYNQLLAEFSHESPEFKDNRIVIGGFVNKAENSAIFDQFYTVGAGLALNLSEYNSGNYSIEAYVNSHLEYEFYFNISFINILEGNTTELNNSAFVFTLPYYSNITRFVLKENNLSKYEKNVSSNTPNISLIFPAGGQIYSNEEIFINWSASDLDGDDLSYAVLFSSDNGETYNTVIFDYNETWFNLSSNNLQDSDKYLIKVLVTDGVLTNESIMNATFEVDNDLQIKNFSIVYQNNTERVFKIALNNTLNQTISNISWEFNSGESIDNSAYDVGLEPSEEALFFIYHNYTISGNYNVSFRARSNDYIESEIIEVIV